MHAPKDSTQQQLPLEMQIKVWPSKHHAGHEESGVAVSMRPPRTRIRSFSHMFNFGKINFE